MDIPQSTVEATSEATSGEQTAGEVEAEAELEVQAGVPSIARWLAWSTWVLSMALTAISLVLEYINDPSSFMSDLLVNVVGTPVLIAYATVGALIASRHPGNPIGWIFCAAALLVAFPIFAQYYAPYALFTMPGSLPGGLEMAWLAGWPRDIGFLLMFTFLLLLFPNGRLPSRRWRAVGWLVGIGIALVALMDAIRPGPLLQTPKVNNPLGIQGITGAVDLVRGIIVLATVAACVVSVIVRFRQAKGDERQQIKWFAYAAVLLLAQFGFLLLLGLLSITLPEAVQEWFVVLSASALAIAAGIAIFKYRLYDIDLLINRTLVYVPLTGILAGVYSASIALFQKVFLAVTGEASDAAIVITTLILASSFTPIKNSLQATVDKRYKEAPDPTRQLRAFSEQVRSFVQLNSPEQLAQRLLDEVISAFHSTGGAVYLDRDGNLELVQVRGNWDGTPRVSVPLKGRGEQFGAVALGARSNGSSYTPQDRQTLQEIADVVAQAIELSELSNQRSEIRQ
jgi:hypothetical protein